MSYHNGPRIVTNGLVLYLDAGNTKSYPGSGTVWNDLSGNRNNGTLINGPIYNSANKGNIVFDGINDYINIPSAASSITSFNVTVGCWINQSAIHTSNTFSEIKSIVLLGPADNIGLYSCFYLHLRNSQVFFRYQKEINTSQLSPGIAQDTNIWHYYTGVSNASSISLYRDGILVGSTPYTITFKNLTSTNSYLSFCNGGALNNYYSGKISAAQIYNRALSGGEVLQNYNATKSRYNL